MKFTVTVEKEKENSNTIDKDYVNRNFIISNIDAMIEHHNNQHYTDPFNTAYNRGIIVGLKEVRDQLENLYNPSVF